MLAPLHRAYLLLPSLALSSFVACADDRPQTDTEGDDLTDPQRPARGTDDIQVWLAAGYYKSWHCEPERHPGRSPSPHGDARICNNDVLHDAIVADGPFPVESAAVKELFNGDTISYAVARKLTDGTGGDRWYWYEGGGDHVYAASVGARNCTNCHGDAPRDFIFTLVP